MWSHLCKNGNKKNLFMLINGIENFWKVMQKKKTETTQQHKLYWEWLTLGFDIEIKRKRKGLLYFIVWPSLAIQFPFIHGACGFLW